MQNKSIVLLSGGLDSTVNLALAKEKTKILLAITFDYNQKSRKKEIKQSKRICDYYKVKHCVIKLPFFNDFIKASLLKNKVLKVPKLLDKDFENNEKMNSLAQMVWVPNRNGLFVNISAVVAESMNAGLVVMGLNKEEAQSFPDNSKAFLKSINAAFNYSTLKKVKLVSYTLNKNKKEIVKIAKKINVPLKLVWSCYFGKKKPCLKCISCLRLKKAMGA